MAKKIVLWALIHPVPSIHFQLPLKTQFHGCKSMTFSFGKDVIGIKHNTKMHVAL